MPQPTHTQLLTALTAQKAGLLRFIALLETEQAALVENKGDALPDLTEQKTQDALKLNQLTDSLRELIDGLVPQAQADIQSWMRKACPECLSVWLEVADLAQRTKQLNQINGELIQTKLRFTQQALTVLSKAVNNANSFYGSNGQPNFSPGSGRSLGSG